MKTRTLACAIAAAALAAAVPAPKAEAALEIENAQFIGSAADPAVKDFGSDYGIKLTLRSSTVLLDSGDKYAQLTQFGVCSKNRDCKPVEFVMYNKYHHENKADPDNPRLVDFYLFGDINPASDYLLTARVGTDTDNFELKGSTELLKDLIAKGAAAEDNSTDFTVSASPLLNKVDKVNAEYNLDTELFGLPFVKFTSKGTVNNNDPALKNGYVTNLSADYFKLFSVYLGDTFNRGLYFWRASLGAEMENDQKLTINKGYGTFSLTVEVPFTNVPSMWVHRRYNILRAAPGLMLTAKYLQSMPGEDNSALGFGAGKRGDGEAEYNFTLNPRMFVKSRFVWYRDLDSSEGRGYREGTLGIARDKCMESYYFIKYVNGYYSTDFTLKLDELTAGIAKKF